MLLPRFGQLRAKTAATSARGGSLGARRVALGLGGTGRVTRVGAQRGQLAGNSPVAVPLSGTAEIRVITTLTNQSTLEMYVFVDFFNKF
ncbi:hypothetical protein [Cupriavidus sp. 8B]